MLVLAAKAVVIVFLAALFVIVAYGVIAGTIRTRGLLSGEPAGRFSPGRIQLLIVTLIAASMYLGSVIDEAGSGSLPDVPGWMLAVVGLSQAGYLGGKTVTRLLPHLLHRR